MKLKHLILFPLLLAMLLHTSLPTAVAQADDYYVEGIVLEDTNGDGVCVEGTDAAAEGIEVILENLDEDATEILFTESDGVFFLEPAAEANWDVTVNPGSGWLVLTAQTVSVVLDEEQTFVDDLLFCLQREAAPAAQATGSIRGFVYNDTNGDGLCTDRGEPGVPGIPLQFVNRDTNATFNQNSAGDGSYSLQNIEGGTWQVTVNPGSGWRVTSQQTRQVLVTSQEPNIADVDFCIVRVQDAGGPTVLPESGAPLAPALGLPIVLGLLLLVAGGLLWRSARRP